MFYELPSPSPIHPGGVRSFSLARETAGGVKMMFHLHPVLSSTTPKSYLHAPKGPSLRVRGEFYLSPFWVSEYHKHARCWDAKEMTVPDFEDRRQ